MHKPDLYRFFAGEWSFSRTVGDAVSSLSGHAQGSCEFRPAQGGALAYREEGCLQMEGSDARINFHRAFVYRIDGDHVQVYFADGEQDGLLYQEYLRQGEAMEASAPHQCAADVYVARYCLTSPDAFEMVTTIDGPRKKSRLLTRYTRKQADSG